MINQPHYDAIVVGLGAMGSATLYQLAKAGARVLGIDQYRPPHNLGSTHGESRITRLATGEGAAYVPFAQRSHAIWRELEAVSGEQLLSLSGGLILCPRQKSAHFHGQGDFVAQTATLAKQFAIAHEVLDPAAVRQRWPQLQVGEGDYGYYEPTGGIVAVEKAVTTQLRLAQQHGATIRFEERVSDYHATTNGVTVQTNQDRYQADKVILTAGAWIADLLPPPLTKQLAVYRQVIYWFAAEKPAQFDTAHFPFVIWIGDHQEEFFTAFPYDQHGTPGLKVVTEEYVNTTNPSAVDRVVHEHEITRMYRDFVVRRMHGIQPTCLKTGVCLYTNTPDDHFLIDFHPASERVIIASPCSGHGFKHSAALGESLSQLALTGKSTLSVSAFTFARLAG